MIDTSSLEYRQNSAIKSFKTAFFQKYGLIADVTVRKAAFENEGVADFDILEIIRILNTHIPSNLVKRFPNIFCKTRKREIVVLRMIFMKMAREKGLKLREITKHTNNTHHSTVIYGADTANDLLCTDASFVQLYEAVISTLKINLQKNARLAESLNQTQNNSQPASVITLYPGKHQDSQLRSLSNSRGTDLPESRMDRSRESFNAEGFTVTL